MTGEVYIQLLQAIRAHSGLELASIREAGEHGADAGWAGFTYYSDTSAFVDSNRSLIWELLSQDADAYGFDSVPAFVASFNRSDMADDEQGFDCLIAWYALEAAGRTLSDRHAR